jgi:excisionase family DNA binding protein
MDEMILISTDRLKTLLEEVVRKVFQDKNPEPTENQLLSIKEASAYLNISISTLYRYTSQRFIPHHKPGKQLYFIKAELEQWLGDHKKLTVSEIEDGRVIFKNNGTLKKNY